MRISDWSSDVCSSDLQEMRPSLAHRNLHGARQRSQCGNGSAIDPLGGERRNGPLQGCPKIEQLNEIADRPGGDSGAGIRPQLDHALLSQLTDGFAYRRSEEHTSELKSLMRISYAVFCLKKKKTHNKK